MVVIYMHDCEEVGYTAQENKLFFKIIIMDLIVLNPTIYTM